MLIIIIFLATLIISRVPQNGIQRQKKSSLKEIQSKIYSNLALTSKLDF